MITDLDYFGSPEFQIINCSGCYWLFRPDDTVGEILTLPEAVAAAQARLERLTIGGEAV